MSDIRISDPNGTSLYEQLSLKSQKTIIEPVQEKENAPTVIKDKSDIKQADESNAVKNVDFVEKDEGKVLAVPLLNKDTGEPLKFVVNDKGYPILTEDGQPQFDPVNGKTVYAQVDEKGNPLLDENNNYIVVETDKVKEFTPPTAEETQPPVDVENARVVGLTNKTTGELLKLKVDENGEPVLDAKGNIQEDPNGQHVYVKVDDNNNIILKDGKPIFVKADGEELPPMPDKLAKVMNTLTEHSGKRLMTLGYVSMGKSLVRAGATKLVKGAHWGIPFTQKSIGFGVKHAVAKAVSAEIKSITSAAGTTTVVSALKTAEKSASVGAVKTLTEAGKLGQGAEVLTMKEAANALKKPATSVAGKVANKLNPIPTVQAAVKSGQAVTKTIAKEVGEKGLVQGTKTIAKNTFIGAGETVLKKGVTEGIETGVKTVLKKEAPKIAEKVTTKAVEKTLVKTAEKAAVKTAVTGTAKVGSNIARFIPVVGAVAGAGITAWDTADAIEKSKDPNASGVSKALAWTTVGLDAVSTVCIATGVGSPIGWVATGLSIGTSIASDYFR